MRVPAPPELPSGASCLAWVLGTELVSSTRAVRLLLTADRISSWVFLLLPYHMSFYFFLLVFVCKCEPHLYWLSSGLVSRFFF